MVARPCAAIWPGAPKQAPSSGVLWPNETMGREQTIDALVYRNKSLDLDSPEYQLINRLKTDPRLDF
jgi:hypothetical protein